MDHVFHYSSYGPVTGSQWNVVATNHSLRKCTVPSMMDIGSSSDGGVAISHISQDTLLNSLLANKAAVKTGGAHSYLL